MLLNSHSYYGCFYSVYDNGTMFSADSRYGEIGNYGHEHPKLVLCLVIAVTTWYYWLEAHESARGSHHDKLRCPQWRQSWHHDNSRFSMLGSPHDKVGIMATLGFLGNCKKGFLRCASGSLLCTSKDLPSSISSNGIHRSHRLLLITGDSI